jgi:hypothetical protein
MKVNEASTFTCWKEIAAYLRKGVRTVQRWEREFGLPVQRPSARSKGIVRASRQELDHWMATQGPRHAAARRKPAPRPVRARRNAQNVATLEELRVSNIELLKQFKESLRLLNSCCEELRDTVFLNNKDGDRKSTAA